jgi:hypothetical protein
MTTTTFPLTKVQRLRKKAATLAHPPDDGPEGWSQSAVDPMAVLAVFKTLRIRDGYILRAYQFRAGGNGNGIVWAMPVDVEFPEPDNCPRLEDSFLEPPKPPTALDDVMKAIDGDGSPLSYLSASLLCRELGEFGAMWHGCSWSEHSILGESPFTARRKRTIACDPWGWKWRGAKPEEWQPQVGEEKNKVTVTFFTYSGLMPEGIRCHTDTFRKNSYCFKTRRKEIASGPGGYVF